MSRGVANRCTYDGAGCRRHPTGSRSGGPGADIWDDDLPGFGLRLFASGRQSWIVQYRAGRRQRRISLGDAAVVTAGEARAMARQLLAQRGLGRDPQAERQAAKRALTVRELIGLYLERQARPRLKARSRAEVERHLTVKAKPLHPLSVDAITRADVARVLMRVARDAPVQANRVRSSLAAVFAWGIAQGLAPNSPVVGTTKPASEKPRERVLTPEELAEVWRHAGDGAYGGVVKLILLTAARRDEAGGMRVRRSRPRRAVDRARRAQQDRPADRATVARWHGTCCGSVWASLRKKNWGHALPCLR